jgi:hypothetical protein
MDQRLDERSRLISELGLVAIAGERDWGGKEVVGGWVGATGTARSRNSSAAAGGLLDYAGEPRGGAGQGRRDNGLGVSVQCAHGTPYT